MATANNLVEQNNVFKKDQIVSDELSAMNTGKFPSENKSPVNVVLVQREIYQPSVSMEGLLLCVLVMLSVLYLIYILFIKLSLTGLYTDEKGNVYELYHDRASDNVRVLINNEEAGNAMLSGNIFVYKKNKALWDGVSKIVFLDNNMSLSKIQ